MQAVLGLEALNHAINRQAAHLHTMEEQTYRENIRARTDFEVAHRDEVYRLRNIADTLVDRESSLQTQRREKQRHEELLKSREAESQEVISATEAARDRRKRNLDAQRDEERNIFESQQLYRRKKLENEKLEQEIRNLEKTGGEGKKP